MTGAGFDQVEQEIIALYARRDYRAALTTLDRSAPDLSAQWERVAYWRACLLARLERSSAALEVLSQAVEAGAWWSPRLLETEADLDPLWEEEGYRELLEVMHRRGDEWAPAAAGLYVAGTPGGWPFLGLHGRNQVYEIDAAEMAGSLGQGWEVAIPESRQRVASDGPVWDDYESCRRQVMEVADSLWPGRRFVLGGFSQGGRRALQIALASEGRVPAVLAVAPMLLRSREVAEVIEALRHPPWPLVVLVTGSEDPAEKGVTAVARHLQDEGLETHIEIADGAGHHWIRVSRTALAALAGRAGAAP